MEKVLEKALQELSGKKVYIYGAQPIAYGVNLALRQLGVTPLAYVVTNRRGNPAWLDGTKVMAIDEVPREREAAFLLSVPEYLHPEIRAELEQRDFANSVSMDSRLEFALMKSYYRTRGLKFAEDYAAPREMAEPPEVEIYVARSGVDKGLEHTFPLRPPFYDVQAGAALDEVSLGAAFRDDEGENISARNRDYAELTVTYWGWKNRRARIKGLAHYRRYLVLGEQDYGLLACGSVDAILPTPYIGWPDASAQYGRYNHPLALEAMYSAIQEFSAEEAERAREIMRGPWVYNYNMVVARAEVFDAYAAWLFPRMLRAGEIFRAGAGAALQLDRPVGHVGELLSSLYFMLRYDDLKIMHARKVWLT